MLKYIYIRYCSTRKQQAKGILHFLDGGYLLLLGLCVSHLLFLIFQDDKNVWQDSNYIVINRFYAITPYDPNNLTRALLHRTSMTAKSAAVNSFQMLCRQRMIELRKAAQIGRPFAWSALFVSLFYVRHPRRTATAAIFRQDHLDFCRRIRCKSSGATPLERRFRGRRRRCFADILQRRPLYRASCRAPERGASPLYRKNGPQGMAQPASRLVSFVLREGAGGGQPLSAPEVIPST